jgi:hypothetical protein
VKIFSRIHEDLIEEEVIVRIQLSDRASQFGVISNTGFREEVTLRVIFECSVVFGLIESIVITQEGFGSFSVVNAISIRRKPDDRS